jgi:hypothetical protein
MSEKNLSFARPSPKLPSPTSFSILGAAKGVKISSQLHYSLYKAPVAFFLCSESEIRAGKLLVDPGHLQEKLVRGRPQKSSPPPYCGS